MVRSNLKEHLRKVLTEELLPKNEDEELLLKLRDELDKYESILRHYLLYEELTFNHREMIKGLLEIDRESKKLYKIVNQLRPRRREKSFFESVMSFYEKEKYLSADLKDKLKRIFRLRYYNDKFKAIEKTLKREERTENVIRNQIFQDFLDSLDDKKEVTQIKGTIKDIGEFEDEETIEILENSQNDNKFRESLNKIEKWS